MIEFTRCRDKKLPRMVILVNNGLWRRRSITIRRRRRRRRRLSVIYAMSRKQIRGCLSASYRYRAR